MRRHHEDAVPLDDATQSGPDLSKTQRAGTNTHNAACTTGNPVRGGQHEQCVSCERARSGARSLDTHVRHSPHRLVPAHDAQHTTPRADFHLTETVRCADTPTSQQRRREMTRRGAAAARPGRGAGAETRAMTRAPRSGCRGRRHGGSGRRQQRLLTWWRRTPSRTRAEAITPRRAQPRCGDARAPLRRKAVASTA